MIKLPAIFTNHMVLQRGKRISVWGETNEEYILLELYDGEALISSNVVMAENGSFRGYLPPMEKGGPYILCLSANKDGSDDEKIKFEDIMVGEVWLAGGQSNMELELQNSKEGATAVSQADNRNIRYYYTPKIPYIGEKLYEEEKKTAWELCDPEHVGRWSAVAYYFAEVMAKELDCTVGIIGCNWGGTSASCWVSKEALESKSSTKIYVDEYEEIIKNQDESEYIKEREEYLIYQAEFDKNVGHYYETAENPTWDEALELYGENKYPGPMGPRTETRPYGLYECMLQRICPYTLGGVIFYQGCEDDHRPEIYFDLLNTYMDQIRKDWSDDKLPIMNVQLPMFMNVGEPDYKNWPLIREAQMRVFQTKKNTGLAVILDKGEYGNIHPTDKKPVGVRLAKQALYHVFNKVDENEAFGPIYKDYYIDGDEVVIMLEHAQDGLICRTEKPEGFEIASLDKVFRPAGAEIKGNIIRVHGDVKNPVYVRYAWTNYSQVSLFGKNGIPVAPFRTDMGDGAVATGSRNTGLFE